MSAQQPLRGLIRDGHFAAIRLAMDFDSMQMPKDDFVGGRKRRKYSRQQVAQFPSLESRRCMSHGVMLPTRHW
jgi:hypothetical protein